MEVSERRVTFEGCRCPGAPHRADWVDVVPRVDITLGASVIGAVRASGGDTAAAEGLIARECLRFGIDAWSFLDAEGQPEEVGPEAIGRLLPFGDAYQVADLVMDLHGEELLRPLLSRTSTRSQAGRTDGSTSPTPASGSKPRTRSEPSSPTSTAGTPSEDPEA